MDYKELLIKYMALIKAQESFDYLYTNTDDILPKKYKFSWEEYEELEKISNQIDDL